MSYRYINYIKYNNIAFIKYRIKIKIILNIIKIKIFRVCRLEASCMLLYKNKFSYKKNLLIN